MSEVYRSNTTAQSCPWVHFFVTQYNPLQVETFGPNPTQPNTTNNDRFPVPVGSAAKNQVQLLGATKSYLTML